MTLHYCERAETRPTTGRRRRWRRGTVAVKSLRDTARPAGVPLCRSRLEAGTAARLDNCRLRDSVGTDLMCEYDIRRS